MGIIMIPKEKIMMSHRTRKMIYNHIKIYPGVSFGVLKIIFNLKDSTLRYHLQFLEKGNKIKSNLKNRKRYYYPNLNEILNDKNIKNERKLLELTKIQNQILITIKRYPGISQKELIKKTYLNRFTLNYNLKKFINMGIIRKNKENRYVCYEVAINGSLD